MEKLKLCKKQIIIGLLLLIGVIMAIKIMVNDVEVVEEAPAVEVVDTTMIDTTVVVDLNPIETIEITKWVNERDSINNAMRYWYGVLDTNSDGDIDN